MTIFEIVGQYQAIYNMMTDPECEWDEIMPVIDALDGQLADKARGYVHVIKQIEMEQKQAEELSKAFAEKAAVRKNNVKRLKETILNAMQMSGLSSVDAGEFTIKVQKNGGKEPLKITGEVPDNMMKVIYEPDNDRIREYLTENPDCEWAHLEERGQHIVIR